MRTISIFCADADHARVLTQAIGGVFSQGGSFYQYTVRGIDVYETERWRTLFKVTHLIGHLMEYSYPHKFVKDISYTDLMRMIPVKSIDRRGEATSLVEAVVPGSDLIIVATENKPEGDSIALEILKLIQKGEYNIPVKRMRCNTFSFRDITEALYNLEEIDIIAANGHNLLEMLDYMYNHILTKQISSYLSSVHLKNTGYIPIGTCQTPLLGILLKREREIQESSKNDGWEINTNINYDKKVIALDSKHGVFSNKKMGLDICTKLRKNKDEKAIVQHVEKRTIIIPPPKPLNFPGIISESHRVFGYDPAETIQILHYLYRKGYISYPFTTEQEYPKDFDFMIPLAEWIGRTKRFSKICEEVQQKGINIKGTSSRKSTPLYTRRPMALRHENDEKLMAVFSLIFRHFIATMSLPMEVIQQIISFSVRDESFQYTNIVVKERGWAETYQWDLPVPMNDIVCRAGDSFDIKDIRMKKKGRAINFVSDIDLFTSVYEYSGTDITDIIEKYVKAGLIKRKQNTLKLTDFGRDVSLVLERNCPVLLNFTARQHFQKLSCNVVSKKISFEEALENGIKIISLISKSIDLRKDNLKEGLEKSIIERDHMIVGTCPECGKPLMVKQYTHPDGEIRRFVGCFGYPECIKSFSLPKEGVLEIYGKCPVTNLTLFMVKKKVAGNEYLWGSGIGPCFQCTHTDCMYKKHPNKSRVVYDPGINIETVVDDVS